MPQEDTNEEYINRSARAPDCLVENDPGELVLILET